MMGATGSPAVTQVLPTAGDCQLGEQQSGQERARTREVKSQPYHFLNMQILQGKIPQHLGPWLSHLYTGAERIEASDDRHFLPSRACGETKYFQRGGNKKGRK